jgi:hypothetical protein
LFILDNHQGLTTPPYAKRRKSLGSGKEASTDRERSSLSTPAVERPGFATPPSKNCRNDPNVPGAPRKVRRRKADSPIVGPMGDDQPLCVDGRRLDFSNESSPAKYDDCPEPPVNVIWDDFLHDTREQSSRKDAKDKRELMRAIRLLSRDTKSFWTEGELRSILGSEISFRNLMNSGLISVNRLSGKVEMVWNPRTCTNRSFFEN